MSMLTDSDISGLIDKGQLIHNGNVSSVRGGAYEFSPGKVFITGERVKENLAADWTGNPGSPPDKAVSSHSVDPGSLVWIRTQEIIDLPKDICAFWWQTHTLSKQGLMLVNMSMVPAGYKGLLSCLFVNFGNRKVVLDPTVPIAKLVFMRLNSAVSTAPTSMVDESRYDRSMYDRAMSSPEQFLHLGRLAQDLSTQRQDAIKAIDDARISGGKALKTDLAETKKKELDDLTKTKERELTDFKTDANKYFAKIGGAAILAVLLLTVAMEWVPWLQSFIKPNLDTRIASQIEQEVSARMLLGAEPEKASRQVLDDILLQMKVQSERLQKLEEKGN